MIKIKTNASRVSLKLKNAGNIDTTGLMREIAGDLEDVTATAFEKEQDPVTGRPWKRLKPSTIAARRRIGKWPGKKLQVFGALVSSITSSFSRTKARIGTSIKYSIYNQVNRRFIGLSRTHIKGLKKKSARFVIKRLRRLK